MAEDLALAQAFHRAGGRKLHFAFADSLMETRMYRSLPELIEGWSKNVYLGGRRSFPDEPLLRALVPAMLVGALLFWLVPPATLPHRRIGGRARAGGRTRDRAVGAVLDADQLRHADPDPATACCIRSAR